MSQILQSVREAAVDGRMQNVIWRQVQLENLQRTLIEHVDAIQAAIKKDNGYTDSEAAIEYYLTLKCLNENYETLNVEQALKDEYAIARKEDAENRREPVGIVYIVPSAHTFFHSVFSAVGAALTAGNCVVIEMGESDGLSNLRKVSERILKSSLDHSIIQLIASRASDDDLAPSYVRLYQDGTQVEQQANSRNTLLSLPSSTRTVAIVDRTADLTSAAQSIAAARFAFGGNSPHAPDLILVNEFVKNQFIRLLMQAAMDQLTMRIPVNGEKVSAARYRQTKDLIAREIESRRATSLSNIGEGSMIHIEKRDSQLLKSKISGNTFMLHSVRSLDDAIDLASRDGEVLATYIFADAESGKYLSQFIPSRVAFVNQIPVEMLVGPVAPQSSSISRSLHVRYPTEIFSIPRPQYIVNSSFSEKVNQFSSKSNASKFQNELITKISKQLTVSKEKRHPGGQIGFFEQGILVGLGLSGVPLLLCMGTLAFYGLSFVWKHVRAH